MLSLVVSTVEFMGDIETMVFTVMRQAISQAISSMRKPTTMKTKLKRLTISL